MAKDIKLEAEVAVVPPKSKKLLIISIALITVLLIVGAAAFFVFRGNAAQDGEDEEVVVEKVKTEKKKSTKETAPVYVALDQFTVNLAPENGDQFLQIMISVEVDDLQAGEKIKNYTPKLRNNVMMLLSTKKSSELMTKSGKEALANELRDLMNQILEPGVKAGAGPLKEVLFTSFIIQ